MDAFWWFGNLSVNQYCASCGQGKFLNQEPRTWSLESRTQELWYCDTNICRLIQKIHIKLI